MAYKIYVTVTLPLSTKHFEMTTDVSQDLEWSEYIKALRLHQYLNTHYPDWQGYDIDIDLDEAKERDTDEEPEIPDVDLETVSVDIDS